MAKNIPFNYLFWGGGSGDWFSGWDNGGDPNAPPAVPDAGTDALDYNAQNVTITFSGGAGAAQTLSAQGPGIGLSSTSATLAISGGTLTISRGSPIGNVVQTGGTLVLANGLPDAEVEGETHVPTTDFVHAGQAGSTAAIYNLTQSAGGVIQIGSGKLSLLGQSSPSGTIAGGGSLSDPIEKQTTLENDGDLTLEPGLQIGVTTFSNAGTGAKVTLAGDFQFSSAFSQGGQANFYLDGHNVALNGTTALSGAFLGPGTVTVNATATANALTLADGATLKVAGTVVEQSGWGNWFGIGYGDTVATLDIAPTGVWNIIDDMGATLTDGSAIHNAGLFEKTGGTNSVVAGAGVFDNTGTIAVAAGKLQLAGGFQTVLSGSLGGHLTGAGELLLSSDFTLADGVVVDVANLTNADSLALGGNLSYGGTYTQGAWFSNLRLAGHNLTLTGQAKLNEGSVRGPGSLIVAGTGALGAGGTVSVLDGATLAVNGSLTETGSLSIGALSALAVGAAGVWNIVNDAGISVDAAGSISNSGLFQKTEGTGVSNINLNGATFANAGTILAASGALKVHGSLANSGVAKADGATLTIDSNLSGTGSAAIDHQGTLQIGGAVAAGETIAFQGGAGDTLELWSPSSFAGKLDGLGAGDVLRLHGVVVTGANVTGSTLHVNATGGQAYDFALSNTQPGHLAISVHDGVSDVRLATGAALDDDFFGHAKSGLLLENTAGAVVVGEVQNGQAQYSKVAALGGEWKFKGNGDFFGDGAADFLIENTDGAVVVADVENGQAGYTQVAALGSEWTFVGTGDFLGLGHDAFLIENTAGAVVVGDAQSGQAQYTQVAALGSEWTFVGSGDFLGRGRDAFLIKNDNSGAVVVGDVQNGQAHYTQVAALGTEWKFVGTGDFLGLGHDAFLIENKAGAVVVGDVQNGQAQYTQVGGLGLEWSFIGAGDYLGTGNAGFVIENKAGEVFLGAIANGQASYTQIGALGSEWQSHS